MEHIKTEEAFISILLSEQEAVSAWLMTNVGVDKFDNIHQSLLSAIKYAYNQKCQLTRMVLQHFMATYKKMSPNEIAAQLSLYDRCSLESVDKNNFSVLLDKVRTGHIRRRTADYMREYKSERDKWGDLGANRSMVEKMQKLEADSADGNYNFEEIHQMKDSFMAALMERRRNPQARLTCGLPEIDDTMNVGFKKGHLTLFCADVSAFKTTLMTNVATNIFKLSNENVLYVPLEMPREEILSKIVARETNVDLRKIEHAEELKEEEIKSVADEMDRWNNLEHRFAIMDMSERTKVSTIKREIEKRISYFQPRVVFIDYVDNLIPDMTRGSRSDLEMNDMLEDMRKMGAALGFHVVSAAQLARDALKRVKEEKEGKTQLGSTDIRGGQVYTANSDNVYAQLRDPNLPNEQLIFFCIKARHGKTTFSNGAVKTNLLVKPEVAWIGSSKHAEYPRTAAEDKAIMETVAKLPTPQEVEDDGSPF